MTLTPRDQTRLAVLNRVLAGQLSASEAAQVLTLSVRQVRRVLAAYREDGAAAMTHGNRGRTPAHAIPDSCREQIVTLARTRYAGVNDRHLTELLAEHEAIAVSRSSLRRILREAGIASPPHVARPLTVNAGSASRRLDCWYNSTPAHIAGWKIVVPVAACWLPSMTPPARWWRHCFVLRKTPMATSCCCASA